MVVNDDGNKQSKIPIIGIGCSALMVIVAFLITVGAALAPTFTDGRASADESLPVMLGGGTCCFFSGLLLAGAIIWFVMARKSDDR